ncbi:MAG: exonuclease [Bacteroidetes bacterium]|nr:MAG: exonuclease [Bacteroidota bacterium]REK08126.1 MAG: exonuclease [Bacteroidota bacterium]REK32331.1 MAG: exonuclease [Bacteroidota bacterium]REK49565.1 MAG: exonuclease [Bacteroidota bacterium]
MQVTTVNNFLTYTKTGLYCRAGDFFLDPKKPVLKALISHAHGDHAVPNNKKVYCTLGTRLLINQRFNASAASEIHAFQYGESFNLNGVKITFHPAGHILGSAQILMEHEGERYLYTGDFKLQQDESCEAFQYVECDHLITETTFASPDYSHPDPVEEIRKIMQSQSRVLIGAYAVGKAQRITQLLTKNCPDREVFIHPGIVQYHKIYERENLPLGNWRVYRRGDFLSSERGVYILPPTDFSRYSRANDIYKMFATGWKRSFYKCDGLLSISDHADWNDLLYMIKKSGARNVYTLHGDGNQLKEYLDSSEINVSILN